MILHNNYCLKIPLSLCMTFMSDLKTFIKCVNSMACLYSYYIIKGNGIKVMQNTCIHNFIWRPFCLRKLDGQDGQDFHINQYGEILNCLNMIFLYMTTCQ